MLNKRIPLLLWMTLFLIAIPLTSYASYDVASLDVLDSDKVVSGEGETQDVYGYIESFPAELIGEWMVDGVTYTADANTEFEQESEAFAVGACVEVAYEMTDNGNLATEISSEEMTVCENGGDDDDGDEGEEVNGYIESFPAELLGEWVVDGVSYMAISDTLFIEENGTFEVGACVEVEYEVTDSENVATEIAAQDVADCEDGDNDDGDDDGDDDDGEDAYGYIESFPADLLGEWVVDGVSYMAISDTLFIEENGTFEVGACVEVEYEVTDSQNVATEIVAEDVVDCENGDDDDGDNDDGDNDDGDNDDGDDDGDDDDSDDNEAKVYATIDSFPASPYVGTWQIGGVTYEATENTEFEEEDVAFAVGVCVEAEYSTATEVKTLLEVEAEEAYKCENGETEQFSTYGSVATLPTNTDLTGTWLVAGVSYEANNQTTFDQTHGAFETGAYLEVKYTVNSNTLVANSIRTHVSPGNGTGIQFDKLTAFDPNDEWNEWVIGGVSYRGDPAMDIATGDRAPRLGNTIAFNSYEQDGSRYLTEVSAAMQLFLPAIQR